MLFNGSDFYVQFIQTQYPLIPAALSFSLVHLIMLARLHPYLDSILNSIQFAIEIMSLDCTFAGDGVTKKRIIFLLD